MVNMSPNEEFLMFIKMDALLSLINAKASMGGFNVLANISDVTNDQFVYLTSRLESLGFSVLRESNTIGYVTVGWGNQGAPFGYACAMRDIAANAQLECKLNEEEEIKFNDRANEICKDVISSLIENTYNLGRDEYIIDLVYDDEINKRIIEFVDKQLHLNPADFYTQVSERKLYIKKGPSHNV